MRPPICDICGKSFDPDKEGELLYFKETEKSREFEKKAEEEGFVGHPPNAAWFCGEHLEHARKLSHLTLDEALEILMKKQDSG